MGEATVDAVLVKDGGTSDGDSVTYGKGLSDSPTGYLLSGGGVTVRATGARGDCRESLDIIGCITSREKKYVNRTCCARLAAEELLIRETTFPAHWIGSQNRCEKTERDLPSYHPPRSTE